MGSELSHGGCCASYEPRLHVRGVLSTPPATSPRSALHRDVRLLLHTQSTGCSVLGLDSREHILSQSRP